MNKNVRIETSKVLLLFVDVLASMLSVFAMAIIWKTEDTAPLSYLIPAIFGLVTTAHGFYFWKAKAENTIKLHKEFGNETGGMNGFQAIGEGEKEELCIP